VGRGVHQGFDRGKERERGVLVSIVEVRVERAEENQRSSCLGNGFQRRGGETPALEGSFQDGPVGVFPRRPELGRVGGERL